MKIFLGVQPIPDYGLDNIYDGLCKILGHENVYDFNENIGLHGEVLAPYKDFPCFFNYPKKNIPNKELLEKIKGNYFDILLCSFTDYTFFAEFYPDIMMDLINAINNSTTPLYLINQGDVHKLHMEKIKYFKKARKYFLREMLIGETYPSNFSPLGFSLSTDYVIFKPFKEKTQKFFWAGDLENKKHMNRYDYISITEKLFNYNSKKKYNLKEYQENLSNSKMSVNLYGYGFDTVRYYEIPAFNTFMLSTPSKTIIPNDFVENESVVYFYSIRDFKKKLEYYNNHLDEAEEIAINGYNHFLKYHTSEARAKTLLDCFVGK